MECRQNNPSPNRSTKRFLQRSLYWHASKYRARPLKFRQTSRCGVMKTRREFRHPDAKSILMRCTSKNCALQQTRSYVVMPCNKCLGAAYMDPRFSFMEPLALSARPRPAGHTRYRPDIDGLRAVAIVSVLLYHAGSAMFGGGFVGVDVFFVISGFLITTILVDEIEFGRFSIVAFYERRVRRIFPALFVVLLFTALMAAFSFLIGN